MEAIIVALIGVVGSILAVMVDRGRKENTRDHAMVADKLETMTSVLQDIDEDVAHIESKLDDHLSDHVKASFNKFGGFDLDDKTFKIGGKAKDKKKGKGYKSK